MDGKFQIKLRMLHEFQLGHSAAEATRNINYAVGNDVCKESTVREWFRKFKNGDISLERKVGSGRRSMVESEPVIRAIENNSSKSTRKLSVELGPSHSTIARCLHKHQFSYRRGRTVPHDLSSKMMENRVRICKTLLSRHNESPFFDRLITCDESWVQYDNRWKQNQWLRPNQPAVAVAKQMHPKRQLLCVWWSVYGIVHWDLIPLHSTITAQIYSDQLQRVQNRLRRPPFTTMLRKGVVFQQDGARPHTGQIALSKIQELGWELLLHPPYSPDLAPSDYYLFSPLKRFLRGKQFSERSQLEASCQQFFYSKSASWYRDGIEKLPTLWQQCISANGSYFVVNNNCNKK